MEQRQGEFKQRPEVKQAGEIPFSKPKVSKTPWILCAILLIIALALGGFLVYGAINQGEKPKCETVADAEMKKTKDVDPNKPEEKKSDEEDTGEKKPDEGESQEEKPIETKIEYVSDTPGRRGFSTTIGTYAFSLYVTKTGDVYIEPYEDMGHVQGSMEFWPLDFAKGSEPGTYGEYTISDKDIDGYVYSYDPAGVREDMTTHTFKGYKVDTSSVVSFNEVPTGMMWDCWNLLFIKEDGSVDELFISPSPKASNSDGKARSFLIKNVGGFKNVANVLSVADVETYEMLFVMRDGTQTIVRRKE